MATGGVHLPRPARLSPPSRGGGGLSDSAGASCESCRTSPSPARHPHAGRRARTSPAGDRDPRPWARRQLCGRWGRGSSRREDKCARRRRPPGGSSGKGDEGKGVLGAGRPRRRRPSRRRLQRPELRRGCAQDASERRGGGTSFGAASPSARPRGTSSLCPRKSGGRGSSISSPGGTPERRSGQLQQGGRVRAPGQGAFRGVRRPPLALPRAPGAGF